jgi:Na+:H+ antiporter, NhaB family
MTGIWLILALAFHLAAVGMIGLSVIVLLTALNGIVEEHQLGHAFKEALPFTALLVVFFTIVAVIHDQYLFGPVVNYVLSLKGNTQLAAYYIANGLLSMISETKMHITDALGLIPDIGMSGALLMEKLTGPNIARSDF